MYVFWVLFLVLSNTNGNQGDPNNGVINFDPDPEVHPLYIVSMSLDTEVIIMEVNNSPEPIDQNIDGPHESNIRGETSNIKDVKDNSFITQAVSDIPQKRKIANKVSLRDSTNDHLCTGSIIAKRWVVSSFDCSKAKLVLYGLIIYEKKDLKRAYEASRELMFKNKKNFLSLFKFRADFYILPQIHNISNQLCLPRRFHFGPNETGEVIGWFLDKVDLAVEMKMIQHVNITNAFSNKTKAFCDSFYKMVGLGSPLIVDNVIYGFFGNCKEAFRKISEEAEGWIQRKISNNTNPLINATSKS